MRCLEMVVATMFAMREINAGYSERSTVNFRNDRHFDYAGRHSGKRLNTTDPKWVATIIRTPL